MILSTAERQASSTSEENPYWISFSDIMAGLLILFILATLLFMLQGVRQQEQVEGAVNAIESGNSMRYSMVMEMQAALAQKGIVVEVADNASAIRIPSTTLGFDSNSAVIRPPLESVVQGIGEALLSAIDQPGRLAHIDTIFVEGHTDNLPSGYKGVGNWLLSSHRAAAVWLSWTGEQGSLPRLAAIRNHRDQPIFSVSGYADTRPIQTPQDTEDQRRLNRRIDIRITMRQPLVCQYREAIQSGIVCPPALPWNQGVP